MKKIFFLLLFTLNCCIVKAQLVVDNSTLTPQLLAQNVLLGQGITISNIKFNNSAISANTINDQIGQFSNGATTNIGIHKGIILSTGNALIAAGPNDRPQATLPTSNSFIGDADLFILSNNQTIRSVAILEFDFVPTGNKLNFNFVFASEEYPEFVNSTYNDNFGFFLSGPGINGPFSGNAQNIALIPTTNLPVSINNLNNGDENTVSCEYCQYYVDNAGGSTIQYDGFTKVLGVTADVQCGQTYHIKLAIANVKDDNYDSAVFIEGASFSADGIDLGQDLTVCSATDYTLKTGLSPTVVHEWTFNGTVIPFEVGPEIKVNQSGTYAVKATPIGISCPVSDEIKIDFNAVKKPDVSCGTKTSNSIQFNWLPIINISEYSVSYKIGLNPEVPVGSVGNVNSHTVSGVSLGEAVVITVTPIGGTPANCFEPNSISCILDNCVISPTIILNQGNSSQQICENSAITDIIYTIGGGATNASITTGALPAGVSASLVGNQFTISGTPTVTGNFSYTISTSGGCGANASESGSINVIQKVTPSFNAVNPICEGENLAALPLFSNELFSGTWSPVLDNLNTTEYTFTPNTGQCANSTKLTITINSKKIPQFTAVTPICSGETIAALPTTSNDLFLGTWTPALDNLNTTEYTFTPNVGQCANPEKLTIKVNSKVTPLFNAVPPICAGETILPLPLFSNNLISGTWSPVLDNLKTTEYTFKPNVGQCANPEKLTIKVNPKPLPLVADGLICKDKITNATIQSYVLDTKLNNADYTFEWFLDGSPIISAIGNTLEAVEKGIYSVIATHKTTNCPSELVAATVTETFSDSTVVKIEQTNNFNNAATITISIIPAIGNFEFQLDNGIYQTSPVFTDVAAGSHTINIVDLNGCYNVSKPIVVLGYPKFFTPNEDGINDTWNIIGFSSLFNPVISIFDRYEKLLKQISPNGNGWDGTLNGHPLPADDYWFRVQFLENGIQKEFKSHFSLKR